MSFDAMVGRRIVIKAENQQRTASFKMRGAYNALATMRESDREAGVIGASSGNHAQALALASHLLRTTATVVIPADAPDTKVDAIRGLGARIVTYDRADGRRDELVAQLAKEKGLTIVPSSDHPAVIAGAGTVAWEMLQDLQDLAAIVVPVGGGGLAAGTLLAAQVLNPRLKVFGVEPANGNDMHLSVRAGRIRQIPPPSTIADGVRHTQPSPLPFEIINGLITDVITVPDRDIVDAMAHLWSDYHTAAEPTGALALAGVLRAADRLPDGPIGVVASGGNVDWSSYRKLLDTAMERRGRTKHAVLR
ncbi:threonine/serine dehydratase [Streptomyces sp. NPDC056296]|uniref:threonine ammonia-lyase n=1 Tax=Streptomyces sp. NPDC056296 TaxID=3345775 RepID=UPI0035DA024E